MVIKTERLILREFDSADFQAVHQYASDPETTQYMDWGPNSESDTQQFITQMALDQSEFPRKNFILRKNSVN